MQQTDKQILSLQPPTTITEISQKMGLHVWNVKYSVTFGFLLSSIVEALYKDYDGLSQT